MSEQHHEFDVFGEPSMTATLEPGAALAGADPAPRLAAAPGPSARKRTGNLFSYGLLAVVALAGLAWMFWPTPPSAGTRRARAHAAFAPTETTPSPVQGVIAPSLPQRAGEEASQSQPTMPTVPMVALPGAGPAQPTQPATDGLAPPEPPKAPDKAATAPQARIESDALVAQVNELQSRLATTDAALAAIGAKIDALAVQPSKPPTPKPRQLAKRQEAPTPKVKPPKQPAVVRALSGQVYTITSINRGVAWIQAGDHVEVVQPGDRIGTTRVLSIDPLARRIETSDGLIQ
jgi:hypothetical protein